MMKTPQCKLTGLYFFLVSLMPMSVSAEEVMELDGMAVIGNSELPKALFIVPWKEARAAGAPDKPFNSLVEESLQPIDPDVFRRKLEYFDSVHRTD